MLCDGGIGCLRWKNLEKLHERHTNRKMQAGEHVAQAREVNTQATSEESENGYKVSVTTGTNLEDMILSEINRTQKNSV